MKTFDELEHMKIYRQQLMIPYDEKNKKKGVAIQMVLPTDSTMEAMIYGNILKNPNLVQGYYEPTDVAYIVNDSKLNEGAIDEVGAVAVGVSSAIISKVCMDIAIKYTSKYIDAKQAKTPTQKESAAMFFMNEFRRGKSKFDDWKRRGGDLAFRSVAPDAWWITWFGIDQEDIRKIGTNEKNKVSVNTFNKGLTKAVEDKPVLEKLREEMDEFLKGKSFYLISSAVEDTGGAPWLVKYFYCPETKKIYMGTAINTPYLSIKYPLTVQDYLDRSKKSMLEIKDVLEICEKKLKPKK